MKNKLFVTALLAALLTLPLWADVSNDKISLKTTVDAAYKPATAYVAGESTHFAPITGVYGGVEGRVAVNFGYKIPTPLGDNFLLKSAKLTLGSKLEVTPVSLGSGIYVNWDPLPFLVFEGGASIGSGWNLGSMYGMGTYNPSTNDYTAISPFGALYYKAYGQGTFQFDTGAIWKGDWKHVQIQYTYQIYYEGMSKANNGEIWMWQVGGNKANGLSDYQCAILAYQMPLVLSRVGVMAEIEGHLNGYDYADPLFAGEANAKFHKMTISPLAQFTFGSHDVLSTVASFSSRRGFKEAHTSSYDEPDLTYTCREWFFYRVALSWTHTF